MNTTVITCPPTELARAPRISWRHEELMRRQREADEHYRRQMQRWLRCLVIDVPGEELKP